MAGKKQKLHFTSLDIVIYATFVFAIGVVVGLGFGKYKSNRFYFAEDRIMKLQDKTKKFQEMNKEINTSITTKIRPTIDTLHKRIFASNTTTAENIPGEFNFVGASFKSLPDILVGSTGIKIDLTEGTTTKWLSDVVFTASNTGIKIASIEPMAELAVCWLALPGTQVS